ncbi:MAG: long-chain-fatty-acid--CoA ligase [Aliidongia sp.]
MKGLMQDWPLTVDRIIEHAARWDGDREIVSRAIEPDAAAAITRTSYAAIRARAAKLSSALAALGIRPGDRVATLGWNTARHLECWFGIMGMGAVCHTLNPRLFREQLRFIIADAGDRIILADPVFAPLLAELVPSVEHVVILSDEAHAERQTLPGALAYETLLEQAGAPVPWGEFDEDSACALCYTSGTTGHPKGVLYSHRSTLIHMWMTLQPDVLGLSIRDVVLPIVPMYHANAWGIPLSAAAVGCKLVLPGARLDGASLHELIEAEGVTFAAAVPTVWLALLQHLEQTGGKLSRLRRVLVGGSACPETVIRRLREHGVETVQGWGMTETSPIGTHSKLLPTIAALPFEEQLPTRLKQGRPPFGIDLRLRDADDRTVPHDGKTLGRLQVRGPVVAAGYLNGAGGNVLDAEGWFDTGDIAHIDAQGYMQIVDRAKDVVKSGGEWVSSVEIENIAASHPKAALCAVIGVPDEKWGERPLLVVQLRPGTSATPAEMLDVLAERISKWWMPDRVVFIEEMPLGATGKIDKKALRLLVPA